MAGARSAKWRRFVAKHPLCCFCGGNEPSVTIDHIPARGLFLSRLWPEGYSFPACQRCNNSSSRDESLITWLVRIRFDGYSGEAEADFKRACQNVQRLAPEVWAEIRFHSRLETRKLMRARGLPDTYPGTDIVRTIAVPQSILEAAARYGEKLAKALHYFHTSTIAPGAAVIKARVFTNAEALAAEFLDRFLAVITGEPNIRSAKSSLSDQFNYRYLAIEDGQASAFVVRFADGIVLVLAVFADPIRYELSRGKSSWTERGVPGG
jgi:hypothetical protein